MENIIVPDLFCPFPSAMNPHTTDIHHQTLAWADRFQLIDNPVTHERFCRAQFSRVVGRAYPNAAPADLRLICDWNTALFVWDDHCDETRLGRQPDQLRARCDQLLDVLQGALPDTADDQLLRAFADVGARLRARMSHMWVRRFVQQVQEYVEGTLWEAVNRSSDHIPDFATYTRMRRFAGALHPYFEFADMTEHIDLPIEVRRHPVVERLSTAAANVVVWANDIVSLEKELLHGDVHNLVTVLQREHKLSLQAAIERAAEIHDAEVRQFIALEACLPVFNAAIDASLQRYIGVLRSWMRANLDWSFETGRYRPEQLAAPI